MQRSISDPFISNLQIGILNPILERVKSDDTLMIAIRSNYINIYYRGGNILKLSELGQSSYQADFHKNYNNGQSISLPSTICSQDDAQEWVNSFQSLKLLMDIFFSTKSKPEREFQQLVARENNSSTISNESEYFITDIEFADSELDARFDMLAIRWLASQRKTGANCRPALIEMKYGDGALGGTSGLIKHLDDLNKIIADAERYRELLKIMENQLVQLHKLGLLTFNCPTQEAKITLNPDEKPEVIFILANHNPRSKQLENILSSADFSRCMENCNFELRFFISSFAGYGLHADCMFSLSKLNKMLKLMKE